jgi:Uma2 family endonuclease
MTITKATFLEAQQANGAEPLAEEEIFYPDSDGEPLANSTLHYELITTTKDGLERLFRDRADVFVAADLFWYPVKGNPKIVTAPDVMVAFGRPPGPRSSYKQWEEGDTPFQVVFEFLSKANTPREMFKKAMFFDRYGVDEYYVYDMERGTLDGFVRYGGELSAIEDGLDGWISPRLGIYFEVHWSGRKTGRGKPSLIIFNPDGNRFLSFLEVSAELDAANAKLGETESKLGETESKLSTAQQDLQQQQERNRLLMEKLRALGVSDTDI